jgi:protein-disulfide isomerase
MSLLEIAGNVAGVNRSKLEGDIDSAKTKQALLDNRALAEKLGIAQTPGYIIGEYLLKQPIGPEDLEAVIKAIREKK